VEAVDLNGRSVLVTGAHGLLGAWLVKALLERGAHVIALRRDEPAVSGLALMGLADRVDIVSGDIGTDGIVARTLAEYEVDSVFHLAAQTLVGVAGRSPRSTFETNIRGTWLVLEACRELGVERVIVSGFMTQMCCDTTTREAAHRGFKVTLLSDATAAMDVKGPDGAVIPHDQVHRTHLGSLNGFLAEVKRTAEVIGAWTGA